MKTFRPPVSNINKLVLYSAYCLIWTYLTSRFPDFFEGLIGFYIFPLIIIALSTSGYFFYAGVGIYVISVVISAIIHFSTNATNIPNISYIILANFAILAILSFFQARKQLPLKKSATISETDNERYRESVLELMSDSVQWLLKSSDWHESFSEVLSSLGKITQVSRIYIFENRVVSQKGLRMSWKFEWVAPGVNEKMPAADTKDFSFRDLGLQYWETLLSQNHIVQGFVSLLPDKPRLLYEEIGLKSFLIIPIIVNNQWWGGIGLDEYRQERNWSIVEKDTLRIAANILGSVIERLENEELVKDLLGKERKQREIFQALSEVGTLLISTHELEPLLDIILEQMRKVINYDSASVLLRFGNKVRISRLHGYYQNSSGGLKVREGFEFSIENTRNLFEMMEQKKPLIIPDTHEYDWLFVEGIEYVRSFAGAPILVQGEVLGFLTLDKAEPDYYQQEHIELLSIFSTYVGIALQNARFLESANRRANEAETFRKASSLVASELELGQVLKEILIQLEKVMPYDSAAIFLATTEGLKVMAGRYLPNDNAIIGQTLPIEDKLFEEISESKSAIILEDAQKDHRFLGFGNTGYIRGWMGLPMYLRGQIIGYLSIDNKRVGAYSKESANLIQAFANEAAIAIENARLFQQVQTMAITDPLTSVFNRRYFSEIGAREFRRSVRNNHPLSLILIDIDHFKNFNDRYGHLAGDQVLKRIGKECQKHLRESDIFARFGGEEFVLLLPETNIEEAKLIAERMLKIINDIEIEANGQMVSVSVSMGVAERDTDTVNLDDLFEHADKALYNAKGQGRGRVMIWDSGNPVNY